MCAVCAGLLKGGGAVPVRTFVSPSEVNRHPPRGREMRILSRLPVRRAPMAAATAGAPAIRRDRPSDPVLDRFTRRPIQLDDRPAPMGAPRGIALAMAVGAVLWVAGIAAVLA